MYIIPRKLDIFRKGKTRVLMTMTHELLKSQCFFIKYQNWFKFITQTPAQPLLTLFVIFHYSEKGKFEFSQNENLSVRSLLKNEN